MDIGILGTGMVGEALGDGLIKGGHRVLMGARVPAKPSAVDWAYAHGRDATYGTFADAATFGSIVFNCTKGENSIEALRMAGAQALAGKVLVDVANPLEFSQGMPPTLSYCNTDSLGERIQQEFPETRVVKALNTINCVLMLAPERVGGGDHDLFICGDDADAKEEVATLLRPFGWKTVHDLGGIEAARATEMLLPLWMRLMGTLDTAEFNFRVVH